MLIQTTHGTGVTATPSPVYVGTVTGVKILFKVHCKTGDIIELGMLPAFCQLIDVKLMAEESAAEPVNIKMDVGLMSGSPGENDPARTCGNEIFDGLDFSGKIVMPQTSRLFFIAPSDRDRSIGMKILSDVPKDTLLMFIAEYLE
ncbi:MAG: hypothetical protein ACRC5A_12395 [Enterobacteriaceae bacterium]